MSPSEQSRPLPSHAGRAYQIARARFATLPDFCLRARVGIAIRRVHRNPLTAHYNEISAFTYDLKLTPIDVPDPDYCSEQFKWEVIAGVVTRAKPSLSGLKMRIRLRSEQVVSMRSSEEQEDFLHHGRFDEGKQDVTRRKVPLMIVAGALLIAASILCLVLPDHQHAVEGMHVGYILAVGCLLSAIPGSVDRTGITSLVCASCLFIFVVRDALLSPAEPNPGAGILAIGPVVAAGAMSSFCVGILYCAVGAVGKLRN